MGKTNSPLRQRLSPVTVKRIQEKALEMGYQPNRGAQMLRTGRSNLIVVLNFGGYSELTALRIYHLSRLIHEMEYDFLSIDAFWWESNDPKAIEQVKSLRPEGVIVIESLRSPFTASQVQEFVHEGIPTVTISTAIPGIPMVRHDIAQATRELTLNALSQGCKRLMLLITGKKEEPRKPWQMRERIQGFSSAVQEVTGLEPVVVNDFQIQYANLKQKVQAAIVHYSKPRNIELEGFDTRAQNATPKLFDLSPLPDALICSNDEFALSSLSQCYRRKIRVPEDLWISGFDNLHYGKEGPVTLTTVAHPIAKLCAEAIKILEKRMKSPPRLDKDSEVHVLPCEVIWRESTGKPNHPNRE